MKLQDLFESQNSKILVIMSGGFHPFSPHHLHVYKSLKKQFPNADVYCAATNSTTERPFSFEQKKFLATQAGIPEDAFVQVKSPYKADEITSKYDPDHTILVFAMGAKDGDRLKPMKKDGSPSYIQKYPENAQNTLLKPLSKQAYTVIAPTVSYPLQGQNITSASQIRTMYVEANSEQRMAIIRELYPNSKYPKKIKAIFDSVLGSNLNESRSTNLSINRDGWVLPNGKFLVADIDTHYSLALKYGIADNPNVVNVYTECLRLGWLRISGFPNTGTGYIESAKPMSEIEKLVYNVAKRMEKSFPIIYADLGEAPNREEWDWDGRQFKRKIKESPDFSYTKFNDKDDLLKQIRYDVNIQPRRFSISSCYDDLNSGEIRCAFKPHEYAWITLANISTFWKGTGLGQILYDKAIATSKELGLKKFYSDDRLEPDAHRAWSRLAKRYPVHQEKDRYVIDLESNEN